MNNNNDMEIQLELIQKALIEIHSKVSELEINAHYIRSMISRLIQKINGLLNSNISEFYKKKLLNYLEDLNKLNEKIRRYL